MKESQDVKDKKYLKGISKTIYILAKIGKTLTIIAIPCIIIAMITIFIVMNKFEYQENTILFDNERVATLKEDIGGINIEFNEKANTKNIYLDITKNFSDTISVISLKKFLDNNSQNAIIAYIEITLLMAGVFVVLVMLTLQHVEKLFRNIYTLKTPFMEENTLHLKNIGILMMISVGIEIVTGIILSLIIDNDLGFTLNAYSVIEILIVFSMYYIFKYGCKLQEKSTMVIYSDNNE